MRRVGPPDRTAESSATCRRRWSAISAGRSRAWSSIATSIPTRRSVMCRVSRLRAAQVPRCRSCWRGADASRPRSTASIPARFLNGSSGHLPSCHFSEPADAHRGADRGRPAAVAEGRARRDQARRRLPQMGQGPDRAVRRGIRLPCSAWCAELMATHHNAAKPLKGINGADPFVIAMAKDSGRTGRWSATSIPARRSPQDTVRLQAPSSVQCITLSGPDAAEGWQFR